MKTKLIYLIISISLLCISCEDESPTQPTNNNFTEWKYSHELENDTLSYYLKMIEEDGEIEGEAIYSYIYYQNRNGSADRIEIKRQGSIIGTTNQDTVFIRFSSETYYPLRGIMNQSDNSIIGQIAADILDNKDTLFKEIELTKLDNPQK